MKKIILNCTRLWLFLTEIPPAILLTVAIIYNKNSDSLLKLYPLIFVMTGVMIFIGMYFFRLIVIKSDEVVQIGRFSSRDKAILNKDKTLILTILPKKRIKIEVYGSDGQAPAFDWLAGSDGRGIEFYLFRGKANGTKKSVGKILEFFGADENDFEEIFNSDSFNKDYDFITVTTNIVNENKEIRIKFNETI